MHLSRHRLFSPDHSHRKSDTRVTPKLWSLGTVRAKEQIRNSCMMTSFLSAENSLNRRFVKVVFRYHHESVYTLSLFYWARFPHNQAAFSCPFATEDSSFFAERVISPPTFSSLPLLFFWFPALRNMATSAAINIPMTQINQRLEKYLANVARNATVTIPNPTAILKVPATSNCLPNISLNDGRWSTASLKHWYWSLIGKWTEGKVNNFSQPPAVV